MGAVINGKSRSVVTVDEIEHLLGLLSGVISARIIVNDWGAIEEIHVLASSKRSPKQIVRDVESSLAAKWNLNVDHKKISVAQLVGVQGPLPDARLKLLSLEVSTDSVRGILRAKVVLGRSDDETVTYEGTAEGACSPNASLKVYSQAVIAALSKACNPKNFLALEDIGIIKMGQRDIAVAVLVTITPRGNEEILVGAVSVRRDPVNAAIRATLDAVNRRLAKLMAGSEGVSSRRTGQTKKEPREDEVSVSLEREPEVAATKDNDG